MGRFRSFLLQNRKRPLSSFQGGYFFVRVFFYPILCFIQALSRIEINYHADIGPGLKILHPSMGVVINGSCIIGDNLTLVGGNVIGLSRPSSGNDFSIGNNVTLGANACVLGPVKLGSNIRVGALACVIIDASSDTTLVGVPARQICKNDDRDKIISV